MRKFYSAVISGVVAWVFAMSASAQGWQNALGGDGRLNQSEFPLCDYRLNIVTLPASGSTQPPQFRIFNLINSTGVVSSTPTTVSQSQLVSAITSADIELLRPFMSTSSFPFNGIASLVVRPGSGSSSTGFSVRLVVGTAPTGTTVTLAGNAQNTFLLEKNCGVGSGGVSSLPITGSGSNSQRMTPPSNMYNWRLSSAFEFPVRAGGVGSFGRIAIVIPSLRYAASTNFSPSSTSITFPTSSFPAPYITLTRQGTATSPTGWSGAVMANVPTGTSPNPEWNVTHTIYVVVFGPTLGGETVLGSTTIAAPHQP